MKDRSYIHPTPEIAQSFFTTSPASPICMLNLLKFKEMADYSNHAELAPASPISGQAAYRAYMKAVATLLEQAGAKVLFSGKTHPYLIGPSEASWDLMLLVRYPSRSAMVKFASSEAYQKVAGHRTAALADSRLLPIDAAE